MKPWADELNIEKINQQFLKVANHGIVVPEGFAKSCGGKNVENGTLNPRSLRIEETNDLVSQIQGGGVLSENAEPLNEAAITMQSSFKKFVKQLDFVNKGMKKGLFNDGDKNRKAAMALDKATDALIKVKSIGSG